jgi:hypothetical protein
VRCSPDGGGEMGKRNIPNVTAHVASLFWLSRFWLLFQNTRLDRTMQPKRPH